MKNYQSILGAVISIYVFLGILDGSIQNYVHFAGPLNELGCAVIAGVMGMMFLVAIDYKKLINALK
jgi:hypothetical protein